MRHTLVLLTLLAVGTVFAGTGCAPMEVSGTVQVRSAPPPPALTFDSDPQFRFIDDRQVYVISDDGFGYDMFRIGGTFYLYSSDQWYRGRSARGPFVAIEERRVPRPILEIDDHEYHWRNHPKGWHGRGPDGQGPPGQRRDHADHAPGSGA